MTADAAIDRLAAAWRGGLGTAPRRVLIAAPLALLLCGAHLARLGTPAARAVFGAALLAWLGALGARAYNERRIWQDRRRTLRAVLGSTSRADGQRAERALSLAERTAAGFEPGSPELARLHLERVLARASPEAVAEAAARRATWWRTTALLLVLFGIVGLAAGPMRVVEGLDVLAARAGRAPMPLPWLDAARVSALPPAYLREPARFVEPGAAVSLPVGTLLTVAGRPELEGRRLVLTDGDTEVPFVRDGSGGVVAHFTIKHDASLLVAARFGGVLIPEPEPLRVRALPDETPRVTLALRDAASASRPAPLTLPLADRPSFELEWEAEDDHGLRQVDLVLSSGSREERLTLEHVDGEHSLSRGAYAIAGKDPFLRRASLPVVIRIEARDGDPIGGVKGAKWGKSESITLVPSALGDAEAQRYRALRGAHGELVDLLASRLEPKKPAAGPPKPNAAAAARAARQRRKHTILSITRAFDGSWAGLDVPPRLRAFARGQLRRLSRPEAAVGGTRALEDVVLALDVALGSLAGRDARLVARRLADVAEEAAAAAHQGRSSEARAPALQRLDAAVTALGAGAERLSALGPLGADLGSVARASIGRIRRARGADDLQHAELAALHLAARLRRPNPSFATTAGGGVEAGGVGEPGGVASEADRRFDQLANELDELIRDHSGEVGKAEQALAEAERGEDMDALRREASEHAENVRNAVEELPRGGGDPDSARASASRARESAESMAHALEQGQLRDAVESGKDALDALEQALKRGGDDGPDPEALKAAREALKKEQTWAERRLERMRSAAEGRASDALAAGAERERGHARRADNLASRGKLGESALSDDVIEALKRAERTMHDAARELAAGRGEKALDRLREAQRQLEEALNDRRPGKGAKPDEQDSQEPGDRDDTDTTSGQRPSTHGKVPEAAERGGADEFRRRVLDGLGRAREGRLAPALRRYADGLLR